MIKPALIVAAAVVFGLAACGPTRHQPPESETALPAIRKQLSDSEEKIDELAHRVTMLQILVDSHQRTLRHLTGSAASGNVDAADARPESPVHETVTVPIINQTSQPLSEMEKAAPVSETVPSESPPEPVEVETAQSPGMETAIPVSETAPSELSPRPQEVEEAQRPETEERLVVAEPNPLHQEAMEKAAPVSETAPSEPSSEPRQAETAQRPETEESLMVPGPNPLYQEAMKIFEGGDFKAAAGLFETFARQFPKDDLADNALYWSGECRYTQKDYAGALKQFLQVIEEYPSGSKVPDTLLKIGFAYLSLGDKGSAVTYLKKVVAQYPFSTAGAKAEERLKRLQK